MDEPTSPGIRPLALRTTTENLGEGQSLLLRPQQTERRLLILLLPLFAVACVTGWADVELTGDARWFERFVMLPAAVVFVGLLVWAIRAPARKARHVRVVTLVVGPGVVLVGFGQQLWTFASHGFDETHYFGMSVWLVLSCALYIFLLPSGYAWRFAVAYYLVSVLMLAAFLLYNTAPIPRFVVSEMVMNNLVAPPLFIALLSAFTRLQVEYMKARTHAEDLRELALVDGLTRLPNRRAFGQSFKRARARLRRNKTPLCAMVLDIDHFKRVNDTLGHQVGDEVLVRLATVLTSELRGTDEVFRWGGEEFAVLLDETTSARLPEVGERIRLAVQNARILDDSPITISIGATHVQPQDDEESVFHRADLALYRSKNEGRNRVTVNDKPADFVDFRP